MTPVLKPPGSPLLKVRYDGPLSVFAFNFNVRRYSMVYSALKTAIGMTIDSNSLGRAVQDDPIKPTFEGPGIKRLKLKYDEPPSRIAFRFDLRRFSWVASGSCWPRTVSTWQGGAA